MGKQKTKKLYNNHGFTGTDLVIAIMLFAMFAGLITQLMTGIYKLSVDMVKSANASAYATIILEKVDEKPFEEITNDFATALIESGEVSMSEDYTITMDVSNIENTDSEEIYSDVIKLVTLKVSYEANNTTQEYSISKLKIKEIYNDE